MNMNMNMNMHMHVNINMNTNMHVDIHVNINMNTNRHVDMHKNAHANTGSRQSVMATQSHLGSLHAAPSVLPVQVPAPARTCTTAGAGVNFGLKHASNKFRVQNGCFWYVCF